MTTASAMRAVICDVCGETTGDFTDDDDRFKTGRCCVDLPEPWGREDRDDEEDDQDYGTDECNCSECREARGD